ncbi:hypothetical protein [Rummeliibacillus sp. TYF-LIM-RU47]|uniref:hypothetical protein n=1 Tax=Rummeliibacillus sp. TYF-LIM-RU47 TaxID=2608406 RepID=UPI00123C5558|nr:hypothetical protein [Rummeliibacillus sp. TYF-LIM-RU47]
MNYKAFYAEVADWILQVNQLAVSHGMESHEFWSWVSRSIGEMANKYENNQLVTRQLTMLFIWLDDIYADMQTKKQHQSQP